MTVEAAEHLIRLYNELMARVTAPKRGFIGFNAKNRSAASELHKFLGDHGLQAGPYLSACFGRYRWLRWPKFGELASESNLRYYRDSSVEASNTWRTLARDESSEQRVAVPRGLEILKMRLLADGPEYCLARQDLTAGWNGQSPLCQTCAVQEKCRVSSSR